MPLAKEVKTKFITDYHRHESDTGSPEVQIAIMTGRIQQLTEHLRGNRHDEVPAAGVCSSSSDTAAGCWLTCARAITSATWLLLRA